jgi:hypothetical protein
VRFFVCVQKDSVQRILIKKCFLFTVGSVCRVKRFTTGCQTFRWWRRGWNGRGGEMAETTVKRLVGCGFRRTGKDQCWRRRCRKMNVFFPPGSDITCFFTFYSRLWLIFWHSLVLSVFFRFSDLNCMHISSHDCVLHFAPISFSLVVSDGEHTLWSSSWDVLQSRAASFSVHIVPKALLIYAVCKSVSLFIYL